MLLCYEVTRDLPLIDVEIETPLARMQSPQDIAGKKLVFVPILRVRHNIRRRHAGSRAIRACGAYRPLSRTARHSWLWNISSRRHPISTNGW